MENDPYKKLSLKEVCEQNNWSKPTLWRRIKSGQFPAGKKDGGKRIWTQRQIDDWFDALPLADLAGEGEAA